MKLAHAPNLHLIGAPRSGTSFLFSMLAEHQEIFAPPIKEPHYYLADSWSLEGFEFTGPLNDYLNGRRKSVWGGLLKSPDDYSKLYSPGASAKWRLEGTPNYFAEGAWMAERIVEHAGDEVRAIVILRDPVERICSHYQLFRQLGWENLGFSEALKAGPERLEKGWAPTWDYLRYSQYEQKVAEWTEVFGERLKVINFDDLRWRPKEVVRDIEAWLGVEHAVYSDKPAFNESAHCDAIDSEAVDSVIAATGRLDIEKERSVFNKSHDHRFAPPLVSIGMPVRNGARTIRRSLESLLSQTYPNLRITVCDNASEDETCAIVEELARDDSRVVLQRFADAVQIKDSYARAMATAQGEYFLFAPADDTWAPGFLSAAVGRMQANAGISVCCGRIELFDDTGCVFRSSGTKAIKGGTRERWREALIKSGDASRLYGLIRVSVLNGLFPDRAPEGWDHYAAAKLALRGEVDELKVLAMYRHRTSARIYRDKISNQEASFFGRVFVMRHVTRLFRDDPEFDTASIGAKAALMSFMLNRTNFALDRYRLKWLYKVFRYASKVLARASGFCSR